MLVKRSIRTSTFSFAAHSSTSASEDLLAPGTQGSHKPIVSLPAACAVRTKGAAIDAAAVDVLAPTRLRQDLPHMYGKHGAKLVGVGW